MKRLYPILSALLLLAACSESDTDRAVTQQLQNSPDFHATFEADDTRTFVDEKVRLLWTEGDLISIFTNTLNQKYEFDGETGDNSGTFTPISSGQFGSGSSLSVDANYAVYPYNQSTKISYDGELSIELPAMQAYAEDSFGVNANTMVAVTQSQNDNFLSFKNLGGFLKLQLYGDVTVKSIHLEGNNGEKIAGGATVTAKYGKNPTLMMDSDATTSITLDCGAGVKLGTSSSSATEFWIVVPPVTFTKGFTITITDTEGGTMTKSTTKSYTVERNVIKSMTAFKVETENKDNSNDNQNDDDIGLDNGVPNNQIWYTSSDEDTISPIFADFGADIISNVYEDGKGVITFNREIISIPSAAFKSMARLVTISLPRSVKSIEDYAFIYCSQLTSVIAPGTTTIGEAAFQLSGLIDVHLPNVTTIAGRAFDRTKLVSVKLAKLTGTLGKYAFNKCSSLKSIELPQKGGGSIETGAFYNCVALESIAIPDGVKMIGESAFNGCTSLAKVSIPNSVIEIARYAFSGCKKLVEVVLPSGIIGISTSTFSDCTALESVAIPNGVTSIGDFAFQDCSHLPSIVIPYSVKSMGTGAFGDCSRLSKVYCKPSTPPTFTGLSPFDSDTSSRKFYVANESLNAYKTASGWRKYASNIIGYDFGENDPDHDEDEPDNGDKDDNNDSDNNSPSFDVDIDDNQIWFSLTDNVSVEDVKYILAIGFRDNVIKSVAENGGYTITLKNGVTSIPEGFFFGDNNKILYNIVIGNCITSIGDGAFTFCSSLKNVTIPNSVTTIGDSAFEGCTSLTNVTIPNGVTTIGEEAFENCTSLINVTIPKSVITIGNGAFARCSSLTNVTIPNGVTTIGEGAFQHCTSLTNVTIPKSVRAIEYGAFEDCI